MTLKQLEQRISELEKKVEFLSPALGVSPLETKLSPMDEDVYREWRQHMQDYRDALDPRTQVKKSRRVKK